MKDKLIEYKRYDDRAEKILSTSNNHESTLFGSEAIVPILRSPYQCYENFIKKLLTPNHRVLELGAGTGMHTLALTKTKATVVAIDISPNALRLLELSISSAGEKVITQVADMECLPFEDSSFDAIFSAGSLSYGEPETVYREIKRILRPNGMFICVDSLGHNPIYRFNRWIHFLRGRRTKSTLKHMPNLGRIKNLTSGFNHVDIQYFGVLSFIMPLVSLCTGQKIAKNISDFVDQFFKIKRSAFKFVLIAQDFQP